MKTRTLLLLAIASGLLILIAGSIKLFLIADEKAPSRLAVGDSATIGDMNVTVRDVSRSDGRTYVRVRLGGVDDPDGAESWRLIVDGQEVPGSTPPARVGAPCAATQADKPVDCVLSFDTTSPGVLSYLRADELLRWDILDG